MKKVITFNNIIIVLSCVLFAFMIYAQFNDGFYEISKTVIWVLAGIALLVSTKNKTMLTVGIGVVLAALLVTMDMEYIATNNPDLAINLYKLNLVAILVVFLGTITAYMKGGYFSLLGHPGVFIAFILGAVIINNLEFFFVIMHDGSNVPIFIPQLWEYSLPFIKFTLVVMYLINLYIINVSLYIRKRLSDFSRTAI